MKLIALIILFFSTQSFAYFYNDYDFAYKKAFSANKKIILEIGAPWCGSCRIYKKEFIPQAKLNHFVKNQLVFTELNHDLLKKSYSKSPEAPKNCNLDPKGQDKDVWQKKVFYCLGFHQNVFSLPLIIVIDPVSKLLVQLHKKSGINSYVQSGYSSETASELTSIIEGSILQKKTIKFSELKNLE